MILFGNWRYKLNAHCFLFQLFWQIWISNNSKAAIKNLEAVARHTAALSLVFRRFCAGIWLVIWRQDLSKYAHHTRRKQRSREQQHCNISHSALQHCSKSLLLTSQYPLDKTFVATLAKNLRKRAKQSPVCARNQKTTAQLLSLRVSGRVVLRFNLVYPLSLRTTNVGSINSWSCGIITA